MIETTFNPGLLLIVAAFLMLVLHKTARDFLLLVAPLIVLALTWLTTSVPSSADFLGISLHRYAPDTFGQLFATAFALALFAGNLFAIRQANTLELSAASFHAGSAIYIVLCGDFVSLLIFWELMMLGSTAIIFAAGTPAAKQAGIRYLLVHALSGVLLLVGILGMIAETGDSTLRVLQTNSYYNWLILAGFLINAGAPPLSAWVSDAYPEASPSGTVYLSAFTTKTAVFALLTVFPGEALIIPLGLYMIFYGIIYALGENDIRRILTYSIVNQVGFMVVGIGIGTPLALTGAAMHAFTHIIYKALLLMSAGSVLMMTQKRKCTELGGLYRSMRLTMVCGIIGALAISAFPLTSGFIAKPMVEEAALNQHLLWLWLALTTASAGVFLHAGIKFPWFVFFQKDSGLRPKDPPLNMQGAMLLFAALCLLLGIFPTILYSMQPFTVTYVPYTTEHLITKLQLLLFSGAAFFILLPWLKREHVISLDVDWLYRRVLPITALWITARLTHLSNSLQKIYCLMTQWLLVKVKHYQTSDHLLAKPAQSTMMVIWLTVFLALVLFIYY